MNRPPNKREQTYAGRVTALMRRRSINVVREQVTNGETDRRTPDQCITLTAMDVASVRSMVSNILYNTPVRKL